MSELDLQLPAAFDPFAEANAGNSGAGNQDYVHIRVQQRNGRKSLTTVQGLNKDFSYSKILKDLKKEFCCNGTVVQDPELGQLFNFREIRGKMFPPSLSRQPSLRKIESRFMDFKLNKTSFVVFCTCKGFPVKSDHTKGEASGILRATT